MRLNDTEFIVHQGQEWLSSSDRKWETEVLIRAAQDQCLPTNAYKASIMMTQSQPIVYVTNLMKLLSECPVPFEREYIIRHDKQEYYINGHLCLNYDISASDVW